MYVALLLVMTFSFTLVLLSLTLGKRSQTYSKDLLVFQVLYFGFVMFMTALYIIYLSGQVGGYITFLSSDSFRYLWEAEAFKAAPFLVDELNGVYLDYNKTPKMGISSLLAWLTLPFSEVSPNTYFLVYSIFVSVCVLFSMAILNRVMVEGRFSHFQKAFFFIFLYFFPTDIYWSLKLLREPFANLLLLSMLLIHVLFHKQGYRRYIVMVGLMGIWLLLFRPQLLALYCLFTLLYAVLAKSYNRFLLVSLSLALLAIVQSIQTMGIGRFLSTIEVLLFNVEVNMDFVSGLMKPENFLFGTFILIGLVCQFSIRPNKFRKKSYLLASYVLITIGGVLYVSLPVMQIRFIYPFFIFVKFALLMHLFKNSCSKECRV